MITTSTLQFLTDLKNNNNKEWFHTNKGRYENAKKEFTSLVISVVARISEFDKSIASDPDVSKYIFRINRDIRFSKDKSPYKINLGAYIVPGGRKSGRAGYYVHIQPGECMVSGGIYMPDSQSLKKIRESIMKKTNDFKRILEDKDFKKNFGNLDEFDKLSSAPRGYPKDFSDIDLLKYKHYTVSKTLTDDEVTKSDFEDKVIIICKAMKPMNNFLNSSLQ